MEDAINSKEDGPPEPSATVLPSSNNDQSSKANAESQLDIPILEKTTAVNHVSFSSVIHSENETSAPNLGMHEDNAKDGGNVPYAAESNHENKAESDTILPRNEEVAELKTTGMKPSPSHESSAKLSNSHRRNISMDQIANRGPNNLFNRTQSAQRFRIQENGDLNRGQIDTAAPFESVKAAVSKFGGIVDWKAHRVQTVEKRKFIEQELSKAQEEIPMYKQQCEAAEEAKKQVMKELDGTRRLIEELKLNLERAQTEEQQAKQDSELAKLRVEELEQGIANEASFAAKAQLEVAKARHVAAVSELKTIKDELEQLRKDYDLLLGEKDTAVRKAEEAVSASKEVEKSVEYLTIELLTVKQSLESAHAAHLEAEEHRIAAVMAKEQETQNWEKELREAEEEVEKLSHRVQLTKDLKSKLSKAMTFLQDLKVELATYMESKPTETAREGLVEDILNEPRSRSRADIEIAISAAKKELAEVKQNIEKTTDEVNTLKVEATSLKSDLDKENLELAGVQQKERMAAITIGSLENEVNRIKSQIVEVQMREKEERERMGDLPTRLHEAAEEAKQAKSLVQQAHEELQRAREEAEQAKTEVSIKESKLHAVQKEIEAAKASEKLALEAMIVLEERESMQTDESHNNNGITLSLEEYYELSKRAHEAEEQANARVAAAIAQVEAAKESEATSMARLDEISLEVSNRKESLEMAVRRAEEAMEAKQAVEQELRKWREQKQNAVDSAATNTENESAVVVPKKKKRSFFPRIFMFLARRKSSHSSKTA